MRKVIRQNTTILDCDNMRTYKVLSVGDGRYGLTHCIEYDYQGNLIDDNVILRNNEIENIVFENYKARAVFRPEEDENVYYKFYIKDDEFTWKHGTNLPELIEELSSALTFNNSKAMIVVTQFIEKDDSWVTTYKTPWMGKDYVQEIDDYYSNPRHGYDTLEECIEYLEKTTSWI